MILQSDADDEFLSGYFPQFYFVLEIFAVEIVDCDSLGLTGLKMLAQLLSIVLVALKPSGVHTCIKNIDRINFFLVIMDPLLPS